VPARATSATNPTMANPVRVRAMLSPFPIRLDLRISESAGQNTTD
jgi:hypothetical protein